MFETKATIGFYFTCKLWKMWGAYLEQVGLSMAFVLTWSERSPNWGPKSLEPDSDSNVEGPTKLVVTSTPPPPYLWIHQLWAVCS